MRRLNSDVVAKRKLVFLAALKEVHGDSIKIVSEYRTMNGKLVVKCNRHGEFNTSAKRLVTRKQGCPKCANVTRAENSASTRRLQEYDKAVAVAKTNNWVVVTKRKEYATTGGKLAFTCVCGYAWQQTAKVAAKAKRCRRCANVEVNKTRQVPLEKRLAAIEFVHDGAIVVVGHDSVMGKFECTVCSNVWKTKLALVAGGSSCSVCASRRATKAPRRIQYQVELCGKTQYVVGYEAHAIRWLLHNKNVPEAAIDLSPPIFTYKERDKRKRYIPDFKVGRHIVEVKSLATAGLIPGTKFASFSTLKRKARAVERAGYNFVLMLMAGETRLELPKDWRNKTAAEVHAYSSSGS